MKPSERSLEGVMAELKALRQAYGAAQRRCTATVQRLHARNQLLEAEVLQLRAQLAAREPSLAMAGDEQRRMLAAAQATQAGPRWVRGSSRWRSACRRCFAVLRPQRRPRHGLRQRRGLFRNLERQRGPWGSRCIRQATIVPVDRAPPMRSRIPQTLKNGWSRPIW